MIKKSNGVDTILQGMVDTALRPDQRLKELKSGAHKPIICRKCGHKLGYLRIKRNIKWKTIRWAIGLAFVFELISNIIVYLIFNGYN